MIYLTIYDDGHGMGTLGKRTPVLPNGKIMKENEFNKRVVELLSEKSKEIKFHVYLTSPTDYDTPLKVRSSNANKIYNEYCDKYGKENVKCVFISIHANAYLSKWGDWGGIDTFYYSKGSYVSKEGSKLAACIQNELIKGSPLRNRGIKGANFHVLRETNMTSCLCECGFMDNLKEAELLISEEYRQECATEIFNGILNYWNIPIEKKESLESEQMVKSMFNFMKNISKELTDLSERVERMTEELNKYIN